MTLRVGEVALRAQVKPDTVRFYEEAGLLALADRSDAGYRRFPEEAAERIRFIKRAQALGFSLEEIAVLLVLRLRAGDGEADECDGEADELDFVSADHNVSPGSRIA